MALFIGLTGGIGSGKSTVARIFSVLGIPVYDADSAARRLMEDDEDLRRSIIEAFGDEAYAGGRLNRKFLADRVFSRETELSRLNALVHPVTLQDAARWAARQQAPYTIKEAALIFESGAQANLDYVIGVSAPRPLRLQRSMERDHISREEVELRMSRQLSESIKMRLCNFILVNNEQELLLPQVLALHEKLLALSLSNDAG